MSRQVPTQNTSIVSVALSKAFGLGYDDKKSGRGFRRGYEKWSTDGQWNYERGRHLAAFCGEMAPKLRAGSKLTQEAITAINLMLDGDRML